MILELLPRPLSLAEKARVLGDLSVDQPHIRNGNAWQKKVSQMVHGTVKSTRTRNAARKRKRQPPLAKSEATVKNFRRKLSQQHFRCHVSNIELSEPDTLSCERLRNDVGYTLNNHVVVHHAFQCFHRQVHWTTEKFQSVPGLREAEELPITDEHVADTRDWINYQRELKDHLAGGVLVDPPVLIKRRPVSHFDTVRAAAKATRSDPSCVSKVLQRKRESAGGGRGRRGYTFRYAKGTPPTPPTVSANGRGRAPVLYNKLQEMEKHARSHTDERNEKLEEHEKHAEPEFDVPRLLDLLESQSRRCAYLGVPLTLSGDDWFLSLERKERDKGYVDGNVCLVCFETNTAQFQWTPAFAKAVFGF